MAEAKLQTRTSESERGVTRRPEYANEFFGGSPFSMMRRFSEEMNRAFDHFFGGMPATASSPAWAPAIEVHERDGNLEIAAELPGLSKDDVKVEATEDGLIIEGERRHQHEETREGIHRSERSYGRFYRMIPLPKGAEADKAKAEFKDGMLQVRVPIPQNKQQRRQIPIGASGN